MFTRSQTVLALSLFALWMMATPYYGVRHDAYLYSAQALLQLNPGAFAHDLFFTYGSQANFTLFPRMHAWAIDAAGFDRAALGLTLLGKLLWFSGLVWFVGAILSGWGKWLALAVSIGVSPFYDQWQVLSYGESFVTARPYAEGLVLLGLGYLLRNRWYCGIPVLLVAMAMHPLMALSGCGAALLLVRWRSITKAIVLFFGIATGGLALAAIGVAPFDKLLLSVDPEWWQVIQQRNTIALLDPRDTYLFGRFAFFAVALLAVRTTGVPVFIRLSNVFLMLGTALELGSYIGATVLHNVLITQLQLWRGIWLVQLVTYPLIVGAVFELWRIGERQRLFAVILASAIWLDGLTAALLVAFAWASIYLASRYWPQWRPSRTIWIVAIAVVMAAGVANLMERSIDGTWGESLVRFNWIVVAVNAVTVTGVTIVLLWLIHHPAVWTRMVGWLVTCVFAIGAILSWYEGTSMAWARESREGIVSRTTIQQVIPESATVYWPGNLYLTWFWLQRSFYASHNQGAGVLFSRATAMEVARRQQILDSLGYGDGDPYWIWSRERPAKRNEPTLRLSDAEKATVLCRDPVLDFLILPAGALPDPVMTFNDPVHPELMRAVFDCSSLRTQPGSPLLRGATPK